MAYQVYEDEHVAGLYRALSLRFHIRYIYLLTDADNFGGKTIDHGLLPTRRYRRAVDEWVRKPPESAHAALALVEFAGSWPLTGSPARCCATRSQARRWTPSIRRLPLPP